jgi:aspartyl-tRNA(Asn)/glutamyl-tRNA(Gln) amidotransferase subunit A
MLDRFIAPYNATVSKSLNAAGAVMLGKTNMDEFAMGSSNETSFYGPVRNPWDLDAVPGGSSGGSAAAVAARLTPGATGTDTGGSIRQPAALCGITGIKPTYGRVSRWGMIAYASSLDQGGPLARTAEDCALLLGAMAGFDPRDSTSVDRPVPDYVAALDRPLTGLKIGLPKEYFGEGLDGAVARAVAAAIAEYRKLGATVLNISLPNSHWRFRPITSSPRRSVPPIWRVSTGALRSSLRGPKDLLDLYTRSRAEGFGPEVTRRILVGTFALSAGYYDAYYLKAQQIRRLISDDFQQGVRAGGRDCWADFAHRSLQSRRESG